MANGRFDDIREVFGILNANQVDYLVLRNYENMLQPELFVGEHADVDMLCADSQEVVKLLGALTNRKNNDGHVGDGIHYYLIVNGQNVSFDLRQVGDGYYCEKWEAELLQRRQIHECFYVMDKVDYFYTLAYHAILQKRSFTEEYRDRLLEMAQECGVDVMKNDARGFLDLVENYMREHAYTQDHLVPNRFSLVNKDMIHCDSKLWWRHKKFDLEVAFIELLVKIKHLILRR